MEMKIITIVIIILNSSAPSGLRNSFNPTRHAADPVHPDRKRVSLAMSNDGGTLVNDIYLYLSQPETKRRKFTTIL